MSREKALKRINEYLAKQEPKKVELALIDDIKKKTSKLEKEWKEALNIAVDGAKQLNNKINAKAKDVNTILFDLISEVDEAEKKLKDLGIGNNADIERAKKELKIAKGQSKELSNISARLRNIY